MKRRSFITAAALSTVELTTLRSQNISQKKNQTIYSQNQSNSNVIKPKALKEGDTIGVVAPGTSVSSPEDYQKVKEVMDFFGLKYKFARNVQKGSGYKSRTIQERVDDLVEMFTDKEVSGIFCIRGGYGSGQLLNFINFNVIKKNPKIFLGYSDITALHLAINRMTNMVTFHGPVLLSEFDDLTCQSLKRNLFSNEIIGTLKNNQDKTKLRSDNPLRTIKSGKAKGQLVGGNLSLICSLMGTRYEILTKNKILFIEDVDEEPYKIDRMLTQLKTSEKLQQANGIVFGQCNNCKITNSSQVWDFTLGEVLNNILADIPIPSYYGLTFGHSTSQFTIPYGLNAEIDADDCTLKINESACI